MPHYAERTNDRFPPQKLPLDRLAGHPETRLAASLREWPKPDLPLRLLSLPTLLQLPIPTTQSYSDTQIGSA